MKKILNTLLFVSLISAAAFADAPKTMGVFISPLNLAGASLDAKFSIKVHDRIALVLPVTAQAFPSNSSLTFTKDLMFFSAGIGAKFFLNNQAFADGFYLEPRVVAGWAKVTPCENVPIRGIETPFLRTSLVAGYGWVWSNGFSLNLGLGGMYNYAFSDDSLAVKKVIQKSPYHLAQMATNLMGLTSGFAPVGEFTLGYSW